MEKVKYLVLISGILIILIIFVIYISMDNIGNKDRNADDEEITGSNTKESKEWTEVSSMNLSLIKKGTFNVGNTYSYNVWLIGDDSSIRDPIEYMTKVSIIGIVRIDKNDYYTLEEDKIQVPVTHYMGDMSTGKNMHIIEANKTFGGCKINVNKDTGNLSYDVTVGTSCILLDEMIISPTHYVPLFLKEGHKFEIGGRNGELSDLLYVDVKEEKELINNFDCLKMETTRKQKVGSVERILERGEYWIDVDKRIPIKIKKYEGNLLVREITLKEIKS